MLPIDLPAPIDVQVVQEDPTWWLAGDLLHEDLAVIGGRQEVGPDLAEPWLGAVGVDGQVVWEANFGHEFGAIGAVAAQGGRVAACGELWPYDDPRPLLGVFDEAGRKLWLGALPDGQGVCTALLWQADGSLAILGYDEDGEGAVAWLAAWSPEEGATPPEPLGLPMRALGLSALPGGDLLLTGYEDESGATQAWLARVGADGDLRWAHAVGGEGDDRLKTALALTGGDVVACGYSTSTADGTREAWVGRWGEDGTTRWSLYVGGPGDEGFKDLRLGDDDSLYLVGDARLPGEDWDLYYAKVDPNGKLLGTLREDRGAEEYGYAWMGEGANATVVGAIFEPASGEVTGWWMGIDERLVEPVEEPEPEPLDSEPLDLGDGRGCGGAQAALLLPLMGLGRRRRPQGMGTNSSAPWKRR